MYFTKGKRYLDAFHTFWYRLRDNELAFDPDFHEDLYELSVYKQNLKKSKQGGSDDKIMKVLIHKQFFSIPWLLCYNDFLA